MSRSKVVFPAELIPSVSIEGIDECMGKHAFQLLCKDGCVHKDATHVTAYVVMQR